MKVLHIDCTNGARKSQLVADVCDKLSLTEQQDLMQMIKDACFEDAGFGNVEFKEGQVFINGRTEVECKSLQSGHFHRSYEEVVDKIDALALSDAVIADVKGIYEILAAAEAEVHRTEISTVHFHEVGNDFAIVSIVLFALAVNLFNADSITASPIATGYGFIECAHGTLAVPAPATANILQGLPTKVGDVEGELCTPTGAAMVKYYAESYC